MCSVLTTAVGAVFREFIRSSTVRKLLVAVDGREHERRASGRDTTLTVRK